MMHHVVMVMHHVVMHHVVMHHVMVVVHHVMVMARRGADGSGGERQRGDGGDNERLDQGRAPNFGPVVRMNARCHRISEPRMNRGLATVNFFC